MHAIRDLPVLLLLLSSSLYGYSQKVENGSFIVDFPMALSKQYRYSCISMIDHVAFVMKCPCTSNAIVFTCHIQCTHTHIYTAQHQARKYSHPSLSYSHCFIYAIFPILMNAFAMNCSRAFFSVSISQWQLHIRRALM